MTPRDRTLYEQNAATWLCRQRAWKEQGQSGSTHGLSLTGDEDNSCPCPTCRADIVRLVDGPPSTRWQDSEKVKAILRNSETHDPAPFSPDYHLSYRTMDALCSAVAEAVSVPPEAAREQVLAATDEHPAVFKDGHRLVAGKSFAPEAASEPVEKVLRDTETYRAMLAQDRYPANFREQAKGVEGVVLPLGSTEAVTRLLRDLVAWGFGMGQAQPESSELLSWHERADATTAKLREHFAASQAENLLLGLHKIVADLAPYFDKPLTDDTIPRWLALDSAQKAIAEYFEEEEEGEELSNPDHDPAVFKHAGTDGRSYYDV